VDLAIVFVSPDTLAVGGEIDLANVSMLNDALDAADGTVVIDLGAVTFMDSSGVRILVLQHRRRDATGDRLVLANLSRSVRRVLEVAGVLEYLDVPVTDVVDED
jgi:anti-anti-sigma factor